MNCFKKITFSLVNMTLIFCMFLQSSFESFDLVEHRDHFVHKCFELYKKETNNLDKLPKAVDYAILIFNAKFNSNAAISITSYLKKSIGKTFEVVLYISCISKYGSNKKVAFEILCLKKLKNKFIHISLSYPSKIFDLNYADSEKETRFLLQNIKFFDQFLVHFFRMYKAFSRFARTRQNTRDSYIRIGDVTNGKRTKVPKKFQIFKRNPRYDLIRDGICVRLHSEIEFLEAHSFDEDIILNNFKSLFGETKFIYFRGYSVYSLENIVLLKHENNITDKYYSSYLKTNSICYINESNASVQVIDFDIPAIPMHFLKTFNIEFTYYNEDEDTERKSKRFRIVFKHSNGGFEFNNNLPVECIMKKYKPTKPIYIYVLWKNIFDIVEFECESVDSSKCKFLRIRMYNVSAEIPLVKTSFYHVQGMSCIKYLLEIWFFNNEIYF
ncbi:hypothetical protein CWI37_0020p0030 [Hamiltosporidium tvaerminnensis]|uniref:Uncharacterized protein n=1 Tax=Hamiltosporidium tvaerminnensis TaxID=1176355 RepID=A0A4Q9LC83_9MICR|nr:hypothetical protein LUQ84_000463 [Hamiltosporidium tvaerminnensis]TBU05364.1 hypothetical protein CWI37_0020p0030 [Hamiltosporidium tvaerminnensis]